MVDIEIDYAARKGLPGFLSESYTGDGAQYTGDVGIPEITVNPKPRITDVGSLYTLGVAYTIAPEKVERFLGGELAGHLDAPDGPRPVGGVQRHQGGGDPVPDHGAHALPDPGDPRHRARRT